MAVAEVAVMFLTLISISNSSGDTTYSGITGVSGSVVFSDVSFFSQLNAKSEARTTNKIENSFFIVLKFIVITN